MILPSKPCAPVAEVSAWRFNFDMDLQKEFFDKDRPRGPPGSPDLQRRSYGPSKRWALKLNPCKPMDDSEPPAKQGPYISEPTKTARGFPWPFRAATDRWGGTKHEDSKVSTLRRTSMEAESGEPLFSSHVSFLEC